MCIFANVPPQDIVALINAAAGYELDLPDLMRIGERGWNLKRAINLRLCLDPASERLPKAFRQPYEDGQGELKSFIVPFDEMREAYYRAREWDIRSGKPLPKKLRQLDLEWLLPDLWDKTEASKL